MTDIILFVARLYLRPEAGGLEVDIVAVVVAEGMWCRSGVETKVGGRKTPRMSALGALLRREFLVTISSGNGSKIRRQASYWH